MTVMSWRGKILKNKLFWCTFITIFFLFLQGQASANGNGTHDNPYVVSSVSSLNDALATSSTFESTNSTLYITLSSDITYTSSDSFKIASNIVVNGDGHAMLYTGTNYTTSTAGYFVTKDGYDVTFSHITFGNSDYSANQTYYGILLGVDRQTNLTVNNVTYYGKNGGQPFVNYNPNSTVTFTGTNTFSSIAGPAAQEFLEGANVIFDDNSLTTISQNTTEGSAVFWNSTSASKLNLMLKPNAKVNIQTNKPYFSYDKPLALNLADSAQLNINNSAYGVCMTLNRASTINMASNSSFSAIGNGKFGGGATGQTTTFAVSDPAAINMQNTASSVGLFAYSPVIVPNNTADYSFDYVVGATHSTLAAAKATINLSDSLFDKNVTQVTYRPDIIATATVSSYVQSNPVKSQILLNNLGVNQPFTYNSARYKVYTTPIVPIDTINQSDHQTAIEKSTTSLYSGTVTSTSGQLANIKAGTYTIYIKIVASSSGGPVTSRWLAKTVTVPKTALNITVPISMTFAAVDNAMFASPVHYEITNQSNFDTAFGVSAITGGANTVNLVDDINTTTQSNPLYLALQDTNGTTMPLIQSEPKTTFDVAAFNGSSRFRLIGQYGGALASTSKQILDYNLHLNFTQ